MTPASARIVLALCWLGTVAAGNSCRLSVLHRRYSSQIRLSLPRSCAGWLGCAAGAVARNPARGSRGVGIAVGALWALTGAGSGRADILVVDVLKHYFRRCAARTRLSLLLLQGNMCCVLCLASVLSRRVTITIYRKEQRLHDPCRQKRRAVLSSCQTDLMGDDFAPVAGSRQGVHQAETAFCQPLRFHDIGDQAL